MVTRVPGFRFRFWGIVLLVTIGVAWGIAALYRGPEPQLDILTDVRDIPAGGAAAHLTIRSSLALAGSGFEAAVTEGSHSARILRTYFDAGAWHVTLQSKALPGKVRVTSKLSPFAPVSAAIEVLANHRDSAGDGTPDVLRLGDPGDAAAFRGWFTYLAEAQFFRETSTLPAEVSDCAGLIRYAYREALRTHDTGWAKASRLPLVPAIPSVRKYEFPYTPWGASLFRTGEAPAALAEFADAETLLRYNTHRVSRDIRQALPGDLIFFRQEDAAMPYHSMIFLGASQIEDAKGPFVIYHTGPSHEEGQAKISGEIRRPAVGELQKHPDPAWHLDPGNPHYLGVYRWNILWQ